MQELPVKLRFLKILTSLKVSGEEPALTVKFGAFEVVPPEVPQTIEAVAAMFLVKPPVPVQVKPIAFNIDSTAVLAAVLVNAMLPEPKEIARVLLLLEEKLPVLKLNPARLIVPAERVNVPVVPNVIASARVTVLDAALIVTLPIVWPVLVTVPDARNIGLRVV